MATTITGDARNGHNERLSGGKKTMTNRLYYGDNLDILRKEIKDESVDLIYLDPPFNSNRAYNLLFKTDCMMRGKSLAIGGRMIQWKWSSRIT